MEEERTYINLYAPHLVNTKTYVCVRAYFNTEGVILPDIILMLIIMNVPRNI